MPFPSSSWARFEEVNLFIALSPVTFLTHQSSLLLSAAKRFHLGDLWRLGPDLEA